MEYIKSLYYIAQDYWVLTMLIGLMTSIAFDRNSNWQCNIFGIFKWNDIIMDRVRIRNNIIIFID